jgi:hypothetical protein
LQLGHLLRATKNLPLRRKTAVLLLIWAVMKKIVYSKKKSFVRLWRKKPRENVKKASARTSSAQRRRERKARRVRKTHRRKTCDLGINNILQISLS